MAETMRHMTPEERRSFDEITNRRNKPLSPPSVSVPSAAEREHPAMVQLWAYLGWCRDRLPDEIVADLQTRFDAIAAALTEVERQRDAAFELLQRWRDDAVFTNRRKIWCDACGYKAIGDNPDAIEHGPECLYVATAALLSGSPEERSEP